MQKNDDQVLEIQLLICGTVYLCPGIGAGLALKLFSQYPMPA
jgi:hypothetical protein